MHLRVKRLIKILLIIIFTFSVFSISFVLSVSEGNKSDLEKEYQNIPFTPFFTVRLSYKNNYLARSYERTSENPFDFMLLYSREISIYSVEKSKDYANTANRLPSNLVNYIPITEKDLKTVKKLKSVKSAFLYNVLSPEYSKTIKFKSRVINIFPVEINFFNDLSLPLEYGRYFKKNDSQRDIIILDNLAKTIFGDENPVGKTLTGSDGTIYNVIGVLRPLSPAHLLSMFPNTYVSVFSPLPENFTPPNHLQSRGSFVTYTDLGNVLAVIPKKGEFNRALRDVKNVLTKNGDGNQLLYLNFDSTYKEMERMFGVRIRKERLVYVLYFSIFMIFVSMFTAIAFVMADILSKTREISIKRAIGENVFMAFSENVRYYIKLSFASFIIAIVLLRILSPDLKNLNNLGIKGFISPNMPVSMLSKTPPLKISIFVVVFALASSIVIVLFSVPSPIRKIFNLPIPNGLSGAWRFRWRSVTSRWYIVVLIAVSITGALYVSALKSTIRSAMMLTYKETSPNVVRIVPVGRENESNIFSGNFYFADFTYNDYLSLKKNFTNKAYIGYRKDLPFFTMVQMYTKDRSVSMKVRVSEATEEFPQIFGFRLKSGRFIRDPDTNVCVLGYEIAEKMKLKTGSYFMSKRIIGIIDKTNPLIDNTVYVAGVQSGNTSVTMPHKGFGSGIFLIRVKNSLPENSVVNEIFDYIYTVLHPNADRGEIINPKAKINDLISVFISLYTLLSLFTFLALLSSFLSLSALLFIEVIRRTREIGIKKAIGATRKDITKEFTLNGLKITTVALAIGIPIGILISLIIEKLKGWNYYIPINILIFVILISLLLGFLFSFLPAYFASKINPAYAVKSE